MLKQYIKKVYNNQNLTKEEMNAAMQIIMTGQGDPVQIATFLTALKMKNETPEEVAEAAKVMLSVAKNYDTGMDQVLDIVGTGGDGTNTFNISTTSSFILAGAGVNVAKHGNRGVSSKSGAADVLENLGVNIRMDPEQSLAIFKEIGITFLFAQVYHPAMRFVGPVRGAMGVKTMFNVLGPLTNPFRANCLVIGAYDQEMAELMVNVYKELGVKEAVVFHGDSGMDEVSTTGETLAYFLKDGEITKVYITPELAGLQRAALSDLVGGDGKENAQITLDILNGAQGPKTDIVLLNCAVALMSAGKVDNLQAGIAMAKESISSGRALEKLNLLIQKSNEVYANDLGNNSSAQTANLRTGC